MIYPCMECPKHNECWDHDKCIHYRKAKQAAEELKRKEREWRGDYNAKTVIEIERTERIRKRKGRRGQ